MTARPTCVHCGGERNGLGVIVMIHPQTGEERGVGVCNPPGRSAMIPMHLDPPNCWHLIKYYGYELGSMRRSIDLAVSLQAEDFDEALDSALEEIMNAPENSGTTES